MITTLIFFLWGRALSCTALTVCGALSGTELFFELLGLVYIFAY